MFKFQNFVENGVISSVAILTFVVIFLLINYLAYKKRFTVNGKEISIGDVSAYYATLGMAKPDNLMKVNSELQSVPLESSDNLFIFMFAILTYAASLTVATTVSLAFDKYYLRSHNYTKKNRDLRMEYSFANSETRKNL